LEKEEKIGEKMKDPEPEMKEEEKVDKTGERTIMKSKKERRKAKKN
jgi:hypothetical protein